MLRHQPQYGTRQASFGVSRLPVWFFRICAIGVIGGSLFELFFEFVELFLQFAHFHRQAGDFVFEFFYSI